MSLQDFLGKLCHSIVSNGSKQLLKFLDITSKRYVMGAAGPVEKQAIVLFCRDCGKTHKEE